MNTRLCGLRITGLLADKDALRIAPCARQNRIGDEPVVEYDIRLLQKLQRAQREKIRIPGTCANEIHLAHRRRGPTGLR